jgi:hypothetical protein
MSMHYSGNCSQMMLRKNSVENRAKWSGDILVRLGWFEILSLLLFLTVSTSAQLVRRPNTTLRLPFEPVAANGDIVLNEAFPGISFDSPVSVRSLPGETNRLFVIERYGRVMVINDLRNPSPEVFLDIHERVFASDWIFDRRTEGLSSIAFPSRTSPRTDAFFVCYCTRVTNPAGEEEFYNCLSEFRASDDRSVGLPDSEIPYIRQFDEGDGHNINDLHFGPDGYLYVAIGDEGDGGIGDDYNNAQKIDKDFFSAIMRIDVDQRPGNLAPNPAPSQHRQVLDSVRQPVRRRNHFSRQASRLDKSPHGVLGRGPAESLANLIRSADADHVRRRRGATQERRDQPDCEGRKLRLVLQGRNGQRTQGTRPPAVSPSSIRLRNTDPGYGQYEGFSVTGGVVYRGSRIPSLYGDLIFADYQSGSLWAMNIDQDPPSKPLWLLNKTGIAGFGYDPRDGEMLVVYHSTTEPGKIYRVEVSGGSTESYPPTFADTGVFADLNTFAPNEGIIRSKSIFPFGRTARSSRAGFRFPIPRRRLLSRRTKTGVFRTAPFGSSISISKQLPAILQVAVVWKRVCS